MQYREFGNTGVMVSAVGLGANRFQSSEVSTADGIERCAEIVVEAARSGVNFFDSAETYSNGKCEEILKLALPQIKEKCYICGKSSSYQEKTSDSVLRYIEKSLKNIGIDCFDFYYMWSIKSLEQYEFIMSHGGAYEGALAAKERGLVKHICFSSHAMAKDAVKMIKDGAFEGVLVSYSLLNFRQNDIVLEAAKSVGVGVAVMNPLAGGIIPQNAGMFTGSSIEGDSDVTDSALRFVYSNPAVSTVLCGVSNMHELKSDICSLSSRDEKESLRRTCAINNLASFSSFCTGCNYCVNCPEGIPISLLMTAYNQTQFDTNTFIYNRTSPELIKHGNFFGKLDGIVKFETAENPCVKCGRCERICTQNLPIIKRLDEIYRWAEKNCVTMESRRKRLKSLISKNYRRIGFYTAGVYTSFVLNIYKQLLEDYDFEIYVFDSNPLKWGKTYLDLTIIRKPEEISKLGLDLLLISNYIHSDGIYNELNIRFPTINIQKLHTNDDLPWIF